MIVVESAGMTDIGKHRKVNEDALFTDDDLGLYVVADGVGGHQSGEIASSLVVETMSRCMKRFNNGGNSEEFINPDPTLSNMANSLISSIQLANQDVHNSATGRKDYQGMGSTVSAIYFTDETLIAANVGDSPIYLIRDGAIDLLSVPHTMLYDQAFIDPDGTMKMKDTYKHVLTRAIGTKQTVTADVCEIQRFAGDIVVICSDGLSDKLCPEEISDIVVNKRPNLACRYLIDLANERGGNDNITVIVLRLNNIIKKKSVITRFISRILGKGVHI